MNPTGMRIEGPVLPVEISVPTPLAAHLERQGLQVPTPAVGRALIDTGASVSAVDETVISNLQVSPVRVATVHTPGGLSQQNVYPARFAFPGTPLPAIDFNAVLGSILKPQGIIALLGRDVLTHFMLIYNGPGGYITLGY